MMTDGRIPDTTPSPSVLIIGHPGHELRVHGWLERARPTVLILTDGSGGSGRSRLSSTTALLERAGATPGTIYGRFTDATIYRALLDGHIPLFLDIVDSIAEIVVRDRVGAVVGDGAEGYNPSHDVCRLLIDAAIRIAERHLGRQVANFAIPLTGRPDNGLLQSGRTVRIELDEAALERKLNAAHAYPEMEAEVAAALSAWGREAFRTEHLFAVDASRACEPAAGPPLYEAFGERRVADGIYQHVIRFEHHVRPLAEALSGHVERTARQLATGA